MPEIQAALQIQWSDAASQSVVQAAVQLQWADGTMVQSVGSTYTPPTPTGAPADQTGSLAPTVDITEATSYAITHTLSVVDLRTATPTVLPVRAVSMDLPDGSDLWTLKADGDGSLYATLTSGLQPPTVRVTIDGQTWSFVVETVDAPQAFASNQVTFGGRSVAALADAPYQAQQQWTNDAPTTAAQVATVANTYTDVDVVWQAPDWLIPTGAFSYAGSPLDVVRQAARAIGAVVEADRDALSVTVRSRYSTLPNKWAVTPPDWQVHWNAVESSRYAQADTPEYNAVFVAGEQQGSLLLARYEGTNGAVQAPMITDPLLTDTPGLLERATVELASYGKQARVTRALQVGADGVIPRGALVRWVDPSETWVGCVRAVSVQASMEKQRIVVRQVVTTERRTAFQSGLYVPPAIITAREWFASQGPKSNLSSPTPPTLSTAMQAEVNSFLAATTGRTTMTFEAAGGSTSFNYTGGSASITSGQTSSSARVYGSSGISQGNTSLGRYNMTPGLGNDPFTGLPLQGSWMEATQTFTYTFTKAITALAFYGVDWGDFSGTFELRLFAGSTLVYSKVVSQPFEATGNAALLFFAVGTLTPFDSAVFNITQSGTGPTDVLGFDQLIVGNYTAP